MKKHKRALLVTSTNSGDRNVASCPNRVWPLDFEFDQTGRGPAKTTDCLTLKFFNITDEFTKTVLAIDVERSMGGDDMASAF